MLMLDFSETLEILHFDGSKSYLEQCRVDSKGSIFTRGDIRLLNIGDKIVRTQPSGYFQHYRIKHISNKSTAFSQSINIEVEEL